jgi:hypothetical protein
LDTKETTKDTIPVSDTQGQDSTAETQRDSKTARSYTEEEVEKKFSQQRSILDKKIASLEKQLKDSEATKSELEAMKQKLAGYEEQREQSELAEARRDPDKLAAWQKKQNEKTRDAEFATRETNLKKREAELNKREAEHAETVKAAQETQLEMALWEIGAKHKVNPVILKDTMKDLNLTTVEQAEALAKRLSGTGERPPETEFNPISGVTSGTSGEPTAEQLEKMSMDDYAAYRKKQK